MHYFITIEDLVMNALIERIERLGKRSLCFSILQSYGETIVKNLSSKNITARLNLNHMDTEQFLHTNKAMLSVQETNTDIIVTLSTDVATDYLRKHYRVRLPFELLSAFVSEQPLAVVLGV